MLTGTANPTPDEDRDCDNIMVLTPKTLPSESKSGPPELPGLIEASVWIISGIEKGLFPDWRVRPTALTTPAVKDQVWPKGLPIVIAL